MLTFLIAASGIGQDHNQLSPGGVDLLANPEDFDAVPVMKGNLAASVEEACRFGEDGQLRVTGKGYGFLQSQDVFGDFHLVLEFKWGERTYGIREDKARRLGVVVRANAEEAVEVQLLESMSGDVAISGAGGEKMVPGEAHDPGWLDQRGWHTRQNSIEALFGSWNRLEVICEGEVIRVKLNGEFVNEVEGIKNLRGAVGLHSQLAECHVRRWELYPLGGFDEDWEAASSSTDTGYTVTGESILPREYSLSPEESLAEWVIDGEYELQIVAAEPLVCDPVDVVWDEEGRMFVAEMRDYPLPAEGGFLSRIRLLYDRDGDGRMDEAKIWADELDNVQGLLPMNGGLLVTTRTAILFLKDTDGDDVADVNKVLFRSNEPKHNQLQVSSPRWGVDNSIYLNNGLDLKEIYPADEPEQIQKIAKTNIRLDPKSFEITPVSGYGQFGATQDDFGRRFFCSNRNPTMMAVMPLDSVKRNPFAGITQGHEDIAPAGENSKVYPLELSHTTSIAHAGTHTAACGLAVFRGDGAPELKGNIFVCEPTAQLVTRSVIKESSSSLVAERVGESVDFLVSGDEWSRPVNIRNGPDGALYICDLYRRFIDHARFFPEAFSESNYMRAGFDQGRIYRLVPKGVTGRSIEPLPESSGDLVALLESDNGWRRIHAQRLLVERGDQSVVGILEEMAIRSRSPLGRLHALWTLDGLGRLNNQIIRQGLEDPVVGVAENAVLNASVEEFGKSLRKTVEAGKGRASFLAALKLGDDQDKETTSLFQKILHNTPEGADPWMRKAVLSGSETRAGDILVYLLESPIKAESGIGAERAEMYREFATAVAARSDESELAKVLKALGAVESSEFGFSVAQGISDGLKKSPLKTKSLAAFIAGPPESCAASIDGLKAIVDSAFDTAANREESVAARRAALPLAGQQELETLFPLVEKLIEPGEPRAIQVGAAQLLSRFSKERAEIAEFFLSRWKSLTPAVRKEAMTVMTSNSASARLVMTKMKEGLISPAMMDPMKQWAYSRSKDKDLKQLAKELFGTASSDRAQVIEDYQTALTGHETDVAKGNFALQKGTCLICHRIGGKGVAVGPDLADVRAKPAEALLTDILDPNRAVEERWIGYTVETKRGEVYSGLIESEDDASMVIKLPGGLLHTVARSEIKKMESTDMSLMPVGLEAALSKEEVADIIGVLKSR